MKRLVLTSLCLGILMPVLVLAQETESLRAGDYFGDMKARQIGPALMSGRINDIAVHPTNSRIVYAGAAGGGVWKSTDAGATFKPIFDDYCQSIGTIAIDPNDPDNTIYVGTGETWTRNSVSIGNGLYKSIDGGANWNKIGLDKSERISSVLVNPENSDEIYVGVLGALWGDSEERGVFKSEDGGQSWERILYSDERTGCADLIMDPQNPNVLYASMWEFRRTAWSFESGGDNSALYKSTDGGKNWDKIHNGFPDGDLGRLAVAVAPSNPKVLYTVIEAEEDERKGLYRSNDSGGSWEQLNNDFGITVRPFYFSRITVDPRDEDVVVKAGLFGSISRDGGKTFKNLGNMHPDIHDIVFSINESDVMYVGTDGGVYRSWDGGTTLEIVKNLPLSQFYHISVDNAEPYNVYGGLQDNGSWYGPSSSPNGVQGRDWNSLGQGDGFRVLKHPSKPVVYSEMQGAMNVWRIDTDRNLVKTIEPQPSAGVDKLRFNWNPPMAVSDLQPDRFYMGSQYLHKSEDMGDTWEIISPDLTTNDPAKQNQEESGGLSKDNSGAENHTTIFTIMESPLDQNIIWVGTDDGNVQITRDGGKSWTNTVANIPGLPANTWCYHIEASAIDKGTAYAVFDGHTQGDMNPYAFKTTDFGASWKSIITDEVEGFARSIQEDYENPDLLFLGTEFGLYISLTGGESWSKFTNNMPAVAIHHLELQKASSDLVMGTHGRGVIILDDVSPLRQINEDIITEKVHFFANSPTVINEETTFGGDFGNETEFIGPSDTKDLQIKYLLSKRHTFGKMSLEIQDVNGNKVADLGAGKAKGVNIVNWNFTRKQPKIAKARTLTFGGFTSPQVPAGKYKAVMIKGKDQYEHEFELIYDPSSPLSLEDRKLKNNTTALLYDMTQELAYFVYELDEFISKTEADGNSKMAAKLNDLKKSVVITTGDNYVGTAESQLREKMAKLYSKVAASYDKPSAADLENLKLITEQFDTAKSDFSKLRKKVKEAESISLKTYEEFLQSK